jgi:hypothetical protein
MQALRPAQARSALGAIRGSGIRGSKIESWDSRPISLDVDMMSGHVGGVRYNRQPDTGSSVQIGI